MLILWQPKVRATAAFGPLAAGQSGRDLTTVTVPTLTWTDSPFGPGRTNAAAAGNDDLRAAAGPGPGAARPPGNCVARLPAGGANGAQAPGRDDFLGG